jgi:MFS superfamily sulfate permease-like transporter
MTSTPHAEPGERPPLRFTLEELAGSMGDFGTIFPIVLGVALVSNVNLPVIFIFFGIWFIIAGLYYRLPIPIEPMKAIGAIVIAEGLRADEIAASGIIIGIFFLLLGLIRGMGRIMDYIPTSVIRGVQGGLALLLLKTSFSFVIDDLLFAGISVGIIVLFYIISRKSKIPDVSALMVIALGIGVGIFQAGWPGFQGIPMPTLYLPDVNTLAYAAWHLAVPQIPLTLTNAILATSLLTHDLFRRDIEPDRFSWIIGLMNLTSTPFGGFPMCHGAGGLAAQYRFGARTGGAAIIAGIILLGFAVFFSSSALLQSIPAGIFGGLLIFVALALGTHALKTDSYAVSGLIAIMTPFFNVTVAFIAGMALAYLLRYHAERRITHSE